MSARPSIALLAACGGEADLPRIRLATITSTYDCSLLDHLLPPFEEWRG